MKRIIDPYQYVDDPKKFNDNWSKIYVINNISVFLIVNIVIDLVFYTMYNTSNINNVSLIVLFITAGVLSSIVILSLYNTLKNYSIKPPKLVYFINNNERKYVGQFSLFVKIILENIEFDTIQLANYYYIIFKERAEHYFSTDQYGNKILYNLIFVEKDVWSNFYFGNNGSYDKPYNFYLCIPQKAPNYIIDMIINDTFTDPFDKDFNIRHYMDYILEKTKHVNNESKKLFLKTLEEKYNVKIANEFDIML